MLPSFAVLSLAPLCISQLVHFMMRHASLLKRGAGPTGSGCQIGEIKNEEPQGEALTLWSYGYNASKSSGFISAPLVGAPLLFS